VTFSWLVPPGFSWKISGGSTSSFVDDGSEQQITPTQRADVRQPISSACTATPFNGDGAMCQGGALGTPFFLFADGAAGAQHLFADAYAPSDIATGAASALTASSATVAGSVNQGGARVKVHFDFGPTTAYGSSTPDQVLVVGSVATAFSAALTGLPAGTTIHYRAVASSDFAPITGADQTFTTSKAPPPPNVRPKVTVVRIPHKVSLRHLGKKRLLKLKLKLSEPARVTIRLLHKKRLVRSLTIVRKKAGSFTAFLSLRGVARRTYKLTITAKDPQGLQSLSVTRTLRVKR